MLAWWCAVRDGGSDLPVWWWCGVVGAGWWLGVMVMVEACGGCDVLDFWVLDVLEDERSPGFDDVHLQILHKYNGCK
ncbi:hypothetical protein HanIR_Chr07g0317751 [Helianthus annuus]|nr:hypothetical protein HanIR_Chr07g0317751 [Helianthus annuus]